MHACKNVSLLTPGKVKLLSTFQRGARLFILHGLVRCRFDVSEGRPTMVISTRGDASARPTCWWKWAFERITIIIIIITTTTTTTTTTIIIIIIIIIITTTTIIIITTTTTTIIIIIIILMIMNYGLASLTPEQIWPWQWRREPQSGQRRCWRRDWKPCEHRAAEQAWGRSRTAGWCKSVQSLSGCERGKKPTE